MYIYVHLCYIRYLFSNYQMMFIGFWLRNMNVIKLDRKQLGLTTVVSLKQKDNLLQLAGPVKYA